MTPETTTPNPQTNTRGKDLAAMGERVRQFIDDLPQQAGDFFGTNRPLLVLAAIALSALVVLALLVGAFESINGIPFLSSLFKLIGTACTIWFAVRYLIFVETRQELRQKLKTWTDSVVSSDS